MDQHLGNLEGKELRFGTSAGATFAAVTVDVTCIFGGKGVGMINLLLFLVI